MTWQPYMSPWRVEHCESCLAPIVWARTLPKLEGGRVVKQGTMQPFDAEPNPDGNRALEERGATNRGRAVPTAVAETAGQASFLGETPIYMPHHATCPDRERWSYAKNRTEVGRRA